MGFRSRFTGSDIRRKLMGDAYFIEKAIISRMQQVGEKFINDAKSERTYKDRSGNLRASIGYFVLKGDVILNYKIEGKPIGVQAAKDLLKAIVQRFRKRDTIRLIGVAGMNYASYVESRGLNVITMQSMVALDDLDKQLKQLEKKTGREFSTASQGVSNTFDL